MLGNGLFLYARDRYCAVQIAARGDTTSCLANNLDSKDSANLLLDKATLFHDTGDFFFLLQLHKASFST